MSEFELLSMRPNLPVADLDRSVAFYRDVLGFELGARMDDIGFALMKGGGAELALGARTSPEPGGAYLYVTGVETLLVRCEAAGATIVAPLTQQPWGLRDFVVEDPDGHRIAIGQRV
ncbi:MAG: VOC family protein [Anaerolineaceae bacterium]